MINNAGVQRPLTVNDQQPTAFLAKPDRNRCQHAAPAPHLHLLPHLQSHPSALILTVFSIGFVPFAIINPGTKASCTSGLDLRAQLGHGSGSWSLRRRRWGRICMREGGADGNEMESDGDVLGGGEFVEVVRKWKGGGDGE